MADDGTDDILRSIKDAQRNALMERAWKVGHEEMRRAGLSDTTIASGHLMAAITLWQKECVREVRSRLPISDIY